MKEMDAQELTMRINSFLAKKDRQFPELDLRGEKKNKAQQAFRDVFRRAFGSHKPQLNRFIG